MPFNKTIKCLLVVGSLGMIMPLYAESDAMQITTHFSDLTGIACDVSAQHCVAVGFTFQPHHIDHVIYTSQDGGIHWIANSNLVHPVAEDPIENINYDARIQMKIACSDTGKDCVVAGTVKSNNLPYVLTYASHDGGINWGAPMLLPLFKPNQNQEALEDMPLVNLQCGFSGNQCLIATYTPYENNNRPIVYTTQNGGQSWSDAIFPLSHANNDNNIQIADLSCDHSGLICSAIGRTITTADNSSATPLMYGTHDGGKTWTLARSLFIAQSFNADYIISRHDFLNQIFCDYSGLNCIALGYHHQKNNDDELIPLNYAYQSIDGGRSWRHAIEIDSNDRKSDSTFTALHCDSTASICTAVGFVSKSEELQPIIYTTSDSGQSWQKKEFEPPLASLGLLDVFCADNAAICHAIGFVLPETA